MTSNNCNHDPTDAVITFDIGNSKTSVYELCEFCRKLPVFTENILFVKEIKN